MLFLKIYPYDPSSKFQEYELGSDLTFIKSKLKIRKAVLHKLGKCEMSLKILPLNVIYPFNNCLISSWVVW